ncbi:MAG: Uncharacterised protein [Cellulomonadaceae bacterium TMED98]|nr:MAG: Uncharacterised protein [Cellulomonadaceae bacterium TMED98]
MHQSEGVGCGAESRNIKSSPRLQIAGVRKTHHIRGTGRRPGGVFAGASGAHFDQWSARGVLNHSAGRSRHRTIVVEHAQNKCFEQDRVGKRALHLQDW